MRKITISSVALILFSISFSSVSGQPKALRGLLDARGSDFTKDRLSLEGEWWFYDDQLLEPDELGDGEHSVVMFPSLWNDIRSSRIGQGKATYALEVLLPKNVKNYAVELPQIYSSYRIWINGELAGANGEPGPTAATTKAQWMPQTLSFEGKDTVQIVLQIANFQHHKGGCAEPIYLGEATMLNEKHSISMVSKLIESGFLLMLAVGFLVVYFLYGRKKVIIYFSLLCVTWAIRAVFSNDYTFITFFPDFDWVTMVRIEYITLYLTMMWAILFLSRLFVNEGSQIIKYVLVTLNGIFVAFTLFNEPLYFTKLLALYLVTSSLLLLYGSVIVIRALINERIGSSLLTLSVLFALAVFAYDFFTFEGLFSYNSIVFSVGYIMIFTFMAVALLMNLNIIKTSAQTPGILTYQDLYGDDK